MGAPLSLKSVIERHSKTSILWELGKYHRLL